MSFWPFLGSVLVGVGVVLCIEPLVALFGRTTRGTVKAEVERLMVVHRHAIFADLAGQMRALHDEAITASSLDGLLANDREATRRLNIQLQSLGHLSNRMSEIEQAWIQMRRQADVLPTGGKRATRTRAT